MNITRMSRWIFLLVCLLDAPCNISRFVLSFVLVRARRHDVAIAWIATTPVADAVILKG